MNTNKIPYQKQDIDDADVSSVVESLKSEFITTGPKVNEFEKKFASSVGAKYAVAVSNGTAALHLACMAAGLSKEDELITSPITFLASSNCALYCGARPIFSDIDDQGNLDIESIKNKISERTKIIVPVHYGGMPLNIKSLREIFKAVIIEDGCHALGAKFDNENVGNCKYSDMTVFSFHPVKHITTGEGGMITTNSQELYDRLTKLRNQGIDPSEKTTDAPWVTPMTSLGYNYRITDFQCALGISQLDRLKIIIEKSRIHAKNYQTAFKEVKQIKLITEKPEQFNSYHLFPILVENKNTRLDLYNFLRKNNILVQIHYQPIYQQPYYQKLGYHSGICPIAERFYERVLSLPIYPSLTENEQFFVINKIKEFFNTI